MAWVLPSAEVRRVQAAGNRPGGALGCRGVWGLISVWAAFLTKGVHVRRTGTGHGRRARRAGDVWKSAGWYGNRLPAVPRPRAFSTNRPTADRSAESGFWIGPQGPYVPDLLPSGETPAINTLLTCDFLNHPQAGGDFVRNTNAIQLTFAYPEPPFRGGICPSSTGPSPPSSPTARKSPLARWHGKEAFHSRPHEEAGQAIKVPQGAGR